MNRPTASAAPPQPINYAYQLFMLVMCLYAIVAMALGAMLPLSPQARDVLQVADLVVCLLFFGDFLWSMKRAENKARYFFTWGWLDLLSSIPIIDPLRVGRFARVVRIIRLLRALRAMKSVTHLLWQHKPQSTFLSAIVVSFSMIIFASLAVLSLEADKGGNIHTAGDALWWAVSTISTVGYGDRFPVTDEGRMVAAVLMTAGVGLFATFSGLIAAWLFQPQAAEARTEVDELRVLVADLRQAVADLQSRASSTDGAKTE